MVRTCESRLPVRSVAEHRVLIDVRANICSLFVCSLAMWYKPFADCEYYVETTSAAFLADSGWKKAGRK